MLKAYQQQNGGLKGVIVGEHDEIPPGALWLDLFNPTLEERRKVDQAIGNELPTRADMEEIEISSRLYQEGDATFMTAMILAQTDTEVPAADAVTFVLTPERLVTIRYIDPQPFRTYALRCERSLINVNRPDVVLMQLFDAIIDRVADILEKTGGDVEVISVEIFAPGPTAMGSRDFQGVLRRLGQKHGLTTKIRESLLTFGRMLTFLTQATDNKQHKEVRAHLKTLVRDVQSLQDHSTFLAGQAQLSPGRDARPDQWRAEQHHQDHVGRGHRVPAAHPARLDLGHEFPRTCPSSMKSGAIRWHSGSSSSPGCFPMSTSSAGAGCRDAIGPGARTQKSNRRTLRATGRCWACCARSIAMLMFAIMFASVRWLGPHFPIGEIVFFRSTLGMAVIVAAAYFAGGLHLLATKRIDSHALSSIAGVISMYCNFTAYTLLPLADVTAHRVRGAAVHRDAGRAAPARARACLSLERGRHRLRRRSGDRRTWYADCERCDDRRGVRADERRAAGHSR